MSATMGLDCAAAFLVASRVNTKTAHARPHDAPVGPSPMARRALGLSVRRIADRDVG